MSKAELLRKLKHGTRGWLARENVVRDGAQREHVQARAMGDVGACGLRGQVHQAEVFNVVFNVARAGGAVHGVGIVGLARSGLPVHQPGRQRASGICRVDHDALRPQRAVVKALGVSVFQRLGNVAHQLQSLGDRELCATITQQVIKALGLGVVIKHQRWAHFALFVIIDLEDAGVADALQHLKLAAGLANPGGTRFRARGVGHGVDAHAALNAFNADVLALPVLEPCTLRNQFDELVVTNLPVLVRGPDAGLGQPTRNGSGLLAIHRVRWIGIDAIGECGNDAVVAQRSGLATQKGCSLGCALQAALKRGGGEKNCRFDKRQTDLGFSNGRLAA